MNLCVVARPKMMKKSNNLFKEQFLMHPNYVLCKIIIVKYSYRSINY
jgi:hypothetical protein